MEKQLVRGNSAAVLATLATITSAAFGSVYAEAGFDWSQISFTRATDLSPSSNWEVSSAYSHYINMELAGDTSNDLRLIFRHTDRVSRSYYRFYRLDARLRSLTQDPNDAFFVVSATGGLRFNFGDGYRIDLPATLYHYNYHAGSGANTNVALRFSPDVRMPLGENNAIRVRGDIHVAYYLNDPNRNRAEFRLRPTIDFNTDGPVSYHVSILIERRIARNPVFSRSQAGVAITATRDLGDDGAYFELGVALTHTNVDATNISPSLATTSYVTEFTYSHPFSSIEGLSLTAGAGYEWLVSNRGLKHLESPFFTVELRRRF